VATLLLTGTSGNDIAKELKLSRYRVTQIMRSPEFKDELAKVCDQMLGVAANTWRGMMQELIPLAYKTLKGALERGDLRGVELVMKSMGLDKQAQTGQSNSITVLLPELHKEVILPTTGGEIHE